MLRKSSPPLPIEQLTETSQIADLCRCVKNEKRCAFDTEFVMEDRFESEVCLLQIATQEKVSIIDPFLPLDLKPIWGLVSDPDVELVVHAGQEDLALCVQHTDLCPQQVYDVQIAAGLAGYEYPLSLQKLVQQVLHIRLHKSKTLTDWRKRPLTDSQISYAAEDVCHLLTVRDRIDDKLRKKKRLDWAKEEFERFEDKRLYQRVEEEKLTRIKGAGVLQGRQLAVMRELLTWREGCAKRWNRPVRVVIKDYLLVEIAKHELGSIEEIRDLRGINLADRDLRELCLSVKSAIELPEEKWPARMKRDTETPREAALVALITGVIRSYCLEHDLAYGLSCTKRAIKGIIRHGLGQDKAPSHEVELLRGWRGETVGVMVMDLLKGHQMLQINSDNGNPVIRLIPSKK